MNIFYISLSLGNITTFNLRVGDVNRRKGGISAFGHLKASEKEVENSVYPKKSNLTYDRKYAKDDYGKFIASFC